MNWLIYPLVFLGGLVVLLEFVIPLFHAARLSASYCWAVGVAVKAAAKVSLWAYLLHVPKLFLVRWWYHLHGIGQYVTGGNVGGGIPWGSELWEDSDD